MEIPWPLEHPSIKAVTVQGRALCSYGIGVEYRGVSKETSWKALWVATNTAGVWRCHRMGTLWPSELRFIKAKRVQIKDMPSCGSGMGMTLGSGKEATYKVLTPEPSLVTLWIYRPMETRLLWVLQGTLKAMSLCGIGSRPNGNRGTRTYILLVRLVGPLLPYRKMEIRLLVEHPLRMDQRGLRLGK